MVRRKSGFADLLAGWPWWASMLLAGVSYALLARGAPRLEVANPYLQPLLKTAAPLLAPLLAVAFLAIAAASALMARRRRTLLDSQQDLLDFEREEGGNHGRCSQESKGLPDTGSRRRRCDLERYTGTVHQAHGFVT